MVIARNSLQVSTNGRSRKFTTDNVSIVWIELASKLKGVLNVAEVNCDENGRLCKREGINGYPMLFLYNAGHKAEYRGSRKIEALESFARKAVNT